MNKDPKRNLSLRWAWIAIIIVVLFAATVRFRLLETPLERDEGEYAYAGQLMLQGIPPYKEAYNMKMPGIYAVYALIMALFGQTHTAIHMGLLIINTATIILLFLLGKKLFNPLIGVLSGAFFALLTLVKNFQGIFANSEHFALLPVLSGALLLIYAADKRRLRCLFWSGFLFGIGFIIKQHAAAFILFAFTYIIINEFKQQQVYSRRPLKNGIIFAFGAASPFILTCLILLQAGVFKRFWFWTFNYAFQYISLVPFYHGLNLLNLQVNELMISAGPIMLFSVAGILGLVLDKRIRQNNLFVGSFFIFSFLSICPGLYFRPHYFTLLFPALAILSAVGIHFVCRFRKVIVIYLAIAVLSFQVYQGRSLLFKTSPNMVAREIYSPNPFPESLEIAKYINARSSKDDYILVLGSEPQIYFYSGRRAATGYIYVYPLMERHRYALQMQKEMVEEIESRDPKFIIFVKNRYSWMVRSHSELSIFGWIDEYLKGYERVGIVDIISLESSLYLWDKESIGYVPRSESWVSIYKRKS